MNAKLLVMAGTLVLLGLAAPASADPTGCLGGGYNPSALTNVCLGTMGGLPTSTGTVGTTPGPCVIGETCVPIPTYNSNGGTPLPVVEIPVLTYADAQAAGVKVEVSQGHPYVYFIGGAGGASANCSHRSGTNVDGEPWSGQDCIVGASGNHVGFFIPDSNPQYSCVYVLNLSNCS